MSQKALDDWVRGLLLTCASSCFLRGEADARITRLPFNEVRAGISRGIGALVGCLGGGAVPVINGTCSSAVSYAGGGSNGILRSDMFVVGQCYVSESNRDVEIVMCLILIQADDDGLVWLSIRVMYGSLKCI